MYTEAFGLSHSYVKGLPSLLDESIFDGNSRNALRHAVDLYHKGIFTEHDVAGTHWSLMADDFFSSRQVPFVKARLQQGRLEAPAGEFSTNVWKDVHFRPGVRARLLKFESDVKRDFPGADRETPLEFHLVRHDLFPDSFAEDRNLFMLYYFIFQTDWDLPEDFFYPDKQGEWITLPSYRFAHASFRGP